MTTMVNPDDPVTHEELAALLSEKLEPVLALVKNLPGVGPAVEDEPDDDGPRFSLREMESYAERQVKKAVKELSGKSAKPATKAKAPVEDDEPATSEPAAKPAPTPPPTPEPTPDPTPGKKSKSERFWGK